MLTSSYSPQDVTFLLKDLSGHQLERSLAEREAAVREGRNYAEVLPVEREPSSQYLALFTELTRQLSTDIARLVGITTEMVLADRAETPVLISLARAGTPVGILMRRWAQDVRGIDLAHYSISIVRGLGIDRIALDTILSRHNAESLMFVDGWTGKGAIAGELRHALAAYESDTGTVLPQDLAVLADPAGCATHFATRDDFLLPSACLNSTVSGLVSRTVYNRELVGPADYHGAKVYSELADADQSNWYLDQITGRFDAVVGDVDATWRELNDADRSPLLRAMAVTESIMKDFGLEDRNLVKPSIGETTRVLLRRVPWKVLINPNSSSDLRHIRSLAADLDVPVVEYELGHYAAAALIEPDPSRASE